MSREAVLLQWERKIEAAERLEEAPAAAPEPDYTQVPRTRRFARLDAAPAEEEQEQPVETQSVAERRTITITGQPTPARRRRSPVVDAQLAQPDRIALWAFLLGLLLVAVAAGTAHV